MTAKVPQAQELMFNTTDAMTPHATGAMTPPRRSIEWCRRF